MLPLPSLHHRFAAVKVLPVEDDVRQRVGENQAHPDDGLAGGVVVVPSSEPADDAHLAKDKLANGSGESNSW